MLFFIYLIFHFNVIYANNYWLTSAKIEFEEPKFTIVDKIDNFLQDIISVENNMTIVHNNLQNKISNIDQQSIEDSQRIVDKLDGELNKILIKSRLDDLYRCRKIGQNEYSKIYAFNDYKKTCLSEYLSKYNLQFNLYKFIFKNNLAYLNSHKQSHSCSMLTSIFKNDCTDEKIVPSSLDLIKGVRDVLDKAANFTNEVNQFTQNITELCSLERLYKSYEDEMISCIIKKDYK